MAEDKDIHNSRLELVFEKRIPGLRVTEALRHREFNMRSRHVHETIELHFLIDGHRLMFMDRETYRMDAGCAMLINHNLIHKTSTEAGFAPDHRNFILQLDRSIFDSLFRQLGYPGFDDFGTLYCGQTRFNENEWTLILSIIDEFKAACGEAKSMGAENTNINSYLYLQAMELCGIYARSRRREMSTEWRLEERKERPESVIKTGVHQKVHDIAIFLQNNAKENVSLDDIASRFFMSKSYLTRIFRSVTGFSVVEYLKFIRIHRAQTLLKNSEMSITEIAAACGFGNITYFEKVFKATTGVSPLQYRKQQEPRRKERE